MYHTALTCLDRDPFVGCCSPPLLSSSGVIPVTVISMYAKFRSLSAFLTACRIPDIMRHYANVILSAESEIFLATNFLQKSKSLTIVCEAFKELSKRVGERGGKKIVVKCARADVVTWHR